MGIISKIVNRNEPLAAVAEAREISPNEVAKFFVTVVGVHDKNPIEKITALEKVLAANKALVYFGKVRAEQMSLENVPEDIREEVEEMLTAIAEPEVSGFVGVDGLSYAKKEAIKKQALKLAYFDLEISSDAWPEKISMAIDELGYKAAKKVREELKQAAEAYMQNEIGRKLKESPEERTARKRKEHVEKNAPKKSLPKDPAPEKK